MLKKIKNKLKSKGFVKLLTVILTVTVLCSLLTISSSAALVYDSPTFTFNFSGGKATITAFFQQIGGNLILYDDGITYVSKLNLNNYLDQLIFDDETFNVYIISYFSSITINGVSYSGDLSYSPPASRVPYSDSYSFSASSSDSSGDVPYFYEFYFYTFNLDDYNEFYLQGFQDGVNSNQAKDKWYPEGYNDGYAKGEQDGLNASDSSSLGQNLIGDTFSAPLRALNQFQLFTAPNGTVITLGMVFGGMLALILFLAFLKMFAGG